jgi:hypothetical protein
VEIVKKNKKKKLKKKKTKWRRKSRWPSSINFHS